MQHQNIRRRKLGLFAYQKEIRFMTGLAVFVSFLLTAAIFWLTNSVYFLTH